ncbi:MAG: glycine zipper family protein [Pseudomonadota bacterium]
MKTVTIMSALVLLLSGCAGLDDTQQRVLTGGAAGAAGGALIGAIAGDAKWGAVAGAGAGLIGGLLVDRSKKNEEAAYRRGVADGRKSK